MKRSVPLALTFLALLAACQGGADESATADGEPASGDAQPELTAAPSAAPSAADTAALLDPEQASREELTTVPGVDAEVADALIAGRPYDDMLAVDRVLAEHLGEEEREAVYERLWKPLDLNSASDEEILLIPGVGERMLHEFQEYRPYRGIEEFRREIGKYVDEATVAGWERYVVVR